MKIHRLWLLVIAAAIALLAPVSGQPPAEGSMGRGEVPPAVRMTGTAQGRLALLVRPLFLLHRGDIRIEARVLAHPENRRLAIAWTSDEGSAGSTQRVLEGEDAPLLHTLSLPSQPPANYIFTATVFGSDGKPRGQADARIRTKESQ